MVIKAIIIIMPLGYFPFIFSLNLFCFSQQSKEQDVNNNKTSNPDGFEQLDPPIRVLDYFFNYSLSHLQ